MLAGDRPPTLTPPPGGDASACVARVRRRPTAGVYAWPLRSPLPQIPIPLLPPDPEVPLDLAALYETTYDPGRYARRLNYQLPLELPVDRSLCQWAEALAPSEP